MTKKEYRTKRIIGIINNQEPNKIWSLTELRTRVNRLLPSNLALTRQRIGELLADQQTYKVFKYKFVKIGHNELYYIFKKKLT